MVNKILVDFQYLKLHFIITSRDVEKNRMYVGIRNFPESVNNNDLITNMYLPNLSH